MSGITRGGNYIVQSTSSDMEVNTFSQPLRRYICRPGHAGEDGPCYDVVDTHTGETLHQCFELEAAEWDVANLEHWELCFALTVYALEFLIPGIDTTECWETLFMDEYPTPDHFKPQSPIRYAGGW